MSTCEPTTLAAALAAYLRARPGRWIDGRELAKVAGAYAWRTRLSETRRPPYNLEIENRQRRVRMQTAAGGHVRMFVLSEYRLIRDRNRSQAVREMGAE